MRVETKSSLEQQEWAVSRKTPSAFTGLQFDLQLFQFAEVSLCEARWEAERGREGGEPGHSSQQESSTAEPCTGTQQDAVGRRMDLG